MSVKASTWAWQIPIKAGLKIVLLALADHSDDSGIAWPGLKGLAKKCSLSRRSLIGAINELIKQGYLTKVNQFDENGRQQSNVYTLTMEGGRVQNLHGEGAQLARGRVQNLHPLYKEKKRHIKTPKET